MQSDTLTLAAINKHTASQNDEKLDRQYYRKEGGQTEYFPVTMIDEKPAVVF